MKYAYLAFRGFEDELASELKYRRKNQEAIQKDRLFFLDEKVQAHWSQVQLNQLETIEFNSISDAVKKLKARGKRWVSFPYHLHRRTQLIQEQLPKVKRSVYTYPAIPVPYEAGFFTLSSENEMLVSHQILNPATALPIEFHEDKVNPPSRAYLKLWESFGFHTEPPRPSAHVIDMGSCPGGWTWVLKNLGCHVTSVDKAPIDERVLKSNNVTYLKKDAFKLNTDEIEKPDWFFSDIICEPVALLELVQKWIDAYKDLRFVCTIKYKGQTDFKTTDQFLRFPGSKIVHLHNNKHEVTWFKI